MVFSRQLSKWWCCISSVSWFFRSSTSSPLSRARMASSARFLLLMKAAPLAFLAIRIRAILAFFKTKKKSICINHVFSQLIIPKIHVVMNYTFMRCLIISLRSAIGIRHLSLFLYFPWSLWGSIEKLTTVKKKINVHNDWIYFTFQRVFLWIHPLLRITTCTSQLSQILTKKQMYVINFNVMICNRYCISSFSKKI